MKFRYLGGVAGFDDPEMPFHLTKGEVYEIKQGYIKDDNGYYIWVNMGSGCKHWEQVTDVDEGVICLDHGHSLLAVFTVAAFGFLVGVGIGGILWNI